MAAKKKSVKKATRSVARTTAKRTPVRVAKPQTKSASSRTVRNAPFLQDFFRFGESYTSLVLGIIVVIAVAGLLVTFTRSRVTNTQTSSQEISATSTAQLNQPTVTPSQLVITEPTRTPTPAPITDAPTPTQAATPTQATRPTTMPTVVAKPTVTIPQPTSAPTGITGKTYTVRAGDDLWNIAVRAYGDGYQWSRIAQVNNLTNPDVIEAGVILQLPEKAPVTAQNQITNPTNAPPAAAITGTTYRVQAGDDLWAIAVRAYGNGYRWVDIARVNNLTMPGIIHAGNTLQLPR